MSPSTFKNKLLGLISLLCIILCFILVYINHHCCFTLPIIPNTHTCLLCPGVNTGVRITFRSDNTNGIGEGALVFAVAAPCSKKRSVPQRQPYAWRPAGVNESNYCRNMYTECKDQKCKFPCVSWLE